MTVTPNIKPLQAISTQKLELKQKKKTSRAWGAFGIGDRNEREDRLIELQGNTN